MFYEEPEFTNGFRLQHVQSDDAIFGAFSLIFWTPSVSLISLFKYVIIVQVSSVNSSIVLRFQKLPGLNQERSVSIASGVEGQATKRQKLDGGLLRKVHKLLLSSLILLLLEEAASEFVYMCLLDIWP
ncbi:hypothetical protein QN277_028904 [Acacia crassicarpa]|uniref:Uncharacterized protein n=1 Tax=Acacia crassicarpa TaxID=499986 RepID=A0AAE1J4C7_9FABA|nr:hypothetical protein QN277_028904 [Acacia crassicarpa]